MECRRLLWCFSFLVIGASSSAIQTLFNTEDLKNIEFGHEYPRHGLLLLHWFAGHVFISETEDIQLDFNPERRDYGFRYYKPPQNVQNMALPQLDTSLDRVYYSMGSLGSEDIRTQLPPYVTQEFYNSNDNPRNDVDRIVVRVHKSNPTIADKVYVTESVKGGAGRFDLNKTYEISSKLLKQVQILQKPIDVLQALASGMFGQLDSNATLSDDPRLKLSKEELLNHLKHNEKRLKTIFEQPGVRWLLSLAGYDIDGRYEIHKQIWLCSTDESDRPGEPSSDPKTMCDGQNPVKIEVKSTSDGYAKLIWSGIPKNILQQEASIVLFSSDTASVLETFEILSGRESGSTGTFVALSNGLHPRLITYSFGTGHGFIGLHYSVIWRGMQFDAANRVIPTEISGYNASLQLYTVQGYACARLYIKKSFTDWKDVFQNSWVGFYTSEKDAVKNYQYYQWVTKFEEADDEDETKEYLIYQYQSSMSIGPGVQARFLFSRGTPGYFSRWYSPTVKARTVPWEKK
ncbi:uncharacterized protein LOC103022979 [Astyanax mexicanus]|uniref:uncharacterized protein LOC103022979 n=1 Tax=Astyanax mexicanus TaxID=7994 RepID=UPI0020CB6358|nr:uncharacterized protein LOC103022979 [Astyanax mexicanus]